jgi:hypothetical protein
MIERKLLADGWMEIRLLDDNGELEAIMELKPTHHGAYAEALLRTQAEIRDRETGPPCACRVIAFPSAIREPSVAAVSA